MTGTTIRAATATGAMRRRRTGIGTIVSGASIAVAVAVAVAIAIEATRRRRAVIAITVSVISVSVLAASCSWETPDLNFDVGVQATAQSSRVYDRNGTLITELRGEQRRTDVTHLDLIPEVVRNAVVAIEDERFYEHDGVDLKAILRAARSNVSAGGISQGGSTITQQYVGNVYLDRSEQTVTRKIEEFFMARRFEQFFTKDFILLRYLNWVYFGNGAYGIEAASRQYFGAPACELATTAAERGSGVCLKVTELTLEQAALLAGLIQRPSAFDPYRNPQDARRRRNLVLERMLANNYIAVLEHERAVDQPIVLIEDVPILEERYPAAYFVEDVKQWFLDNPAFGPTREYRTQLLFEGGLDIYTTIDLGLQAKAEATVEALMPNNGINPDAAATVLGVGGAEDGHVLAMVGGRDFFGDDEDAKFNLASGKGRQAGSAMKPIALATALTRGYSVTESYEAPDELEIDRPDVCGPVWTIRGGLGSEPEAPVEANLVAATRRSINTIYAQLMVDIRPANFVTMAERLGLEPGRIAPVCAGVLGTEDVNTVELATMFSTFARRGRRVDPVTVTSIIQPDGTALYRNVSDILPVLDQSIANQITWVLQGAITEGTGRKAAIDRPAAGKTGTAQNYADATFVGYTPQRAAAVWVGFPEAQIPMVPPTTDIRVSGGTYPAQIWREIMIAAHQDIAAVDLPTPPPSALPAPTQPPRLDSVEIPELAGRTWDFELLAAELGELTLGVAAVEVQTGEFAEGTIIGQAPAAGTLQRGGITVTVEVAVAPELPSALAMPDVVGLSEAEARQVLTAAGLGVEVYVEPFFDEEAGRFGGAPGAVWRQLPAADTTLEPGGSAEIWVNTDQ